MRDSESRPARRRGLGGMLDGRVIPRAIPRSGRLWLSPEFWRRRFIFWAGGVAVGVAAVGFALLADEAQARFRAMIRLSPYLPLVVTPLGLALAAAVAGRFFPNSQGSGIPQAIAARQLADPAARHRLLSLRIGLGKIALTLFGLLAGAAIGREGPTVQVGAAIMLATGRFAGGQYRGLVLAGGAAGVAAAFNTPLAGVVFAIEELSRAFEQRTSGLVLTTVILAGIASLALLGNYTYFGHTAAALHSAYDGVAVVVCGIGGGLLGGGFSRAVIAAARGLPGRIGAAIQRHPIVFAALCGLGVALLGMVSGGTIYGTGYAEAKEILEGADHMPHAFGILKLAATLLSSVSGIPGGIFAPSLAIGAGFGANATALLPGIPVGAVVVLGMVAYLAGVVQAPITAFVIVLEMTDNNAMTVPLMAASLIAFGVSRLVCPRSIYHALADRLVAAARAERREPVPEP